MNRAVKQRGFSLLELMIVLAVVAILALIATPGYMKFMTKAHRNDMQVTMERHAQELERCYSHYNRYDACGIDTEYKESTHCTDHQLECPYEFYELTINPLNAREFTLTAVPIGGQVRDVCGKMTLDQTGKRGLDPSNTLSVRDCWK